MVGGMVSSTLLTLIVIPAIYFLYKSWENRKGWRPNDEITEANNQANLSAE
jgi:Cu(I)/Ag(I) efflux system membrane protein CusA/SilA